MNSRYECEACGRAISRAMYINGLRLKGRAHCFTCQAVRIEREAPPKLAKFLNKELMNKFGVTQEQIEANSKLPYWQNH